MLLPETQTGFCRIRKDIGTVAAEDGGPVPHSSSPFDAMDGGDPPRPVLRRHTTGRIHNGSCRHRIAKDAAAVERNGNGLTDFAVM